MCELRLELRKGHEVVARARLIRLGTREHRVILRVHGKLPQAGGYVVEARKHGSVLARRAVTVPRARKLSQLAG